MTTTSIMRSGQHRVDIVQVTSQRVTFRHNGRESSIVGSIASASAGELRAQAAEQIKRANEAVRRAAIMTAVADQKDIWAAAHAEQAAKQRRERAAATRAHNADPFGFKATLGG